MQYVSNLNGLDHEGTNIWVAFELGLESFQIVIWDQVEPGDKRAEALLGRRVCGR